MSDPKPPLDGLSAEEKRRLLAQMLEERARAEAATFALSHGQQALWFLYQRAPESTAYNIASAVRVRPPLDTAVFRGAFAALARRHPMLRATFGMEDGAPVQRIRDDQEVSFTSVEEAADWNDDELFEAMNAETHRPFDLEQGPVYRVVLYSRPDGSHVFLFVVHHIVYDGVCNGVVLEEIGALYAALKSGGDEPPAPTGPQYRDYVKWQRQFLEGEQGRKHFTYWEQQLSGDLPVLDLPFDRPRRADPRFRGASVPLDFTLERCRQLRALARERQTTVYTIVLAALNVLLSRYSGQSDILVGASAAGRTRAEFEKIIGYFVNPVVVRGDLTENPTFSSFLDTTRRNVVRALEHQDVPFSLLVERLHPHRDSSHNPIFQVMFDWQIRVDGDAGSDASQDRIRLGELDLEVLRLPQQEGQFDIVLDINEIGERLTGTFSYDADLFDASTVATMQEHFQTLLDGIIADPDRPIADLPLLGPEERRRLLVDWNATASEYPRDRCLHQLFEASAARDPDAVAVECGDLQRTYGELNRRSDLLARRLVARHGVGPDVFVAIYMERSIDMLVGLLAVLKANGAYLPLDPVYPAERVSYMLEDAGAAVVLTESGVLEGLPAERPPVICLDREWEDIETESGGAPDPSLASPENLAYVIYTSGSTGKPKGVMVPHRGVVNFLESMGKRPGLTSDDALFAVTTIAFDIHVLELFLPLSRGARVIVADRNVIADGRRLLEAIRTSGATIMQATPTAWQMLIDSGWDQRIPLKVLCGGEALSLELAQGLLERCDSLWNMYGPTETTIWSSVHRVEPGETAISIGRPIDNTQFYILDAAREPVPVGVRGELYIGGDGLTRGYLNRPELTAEKFVPDTFVPGEGRRLYATGDRARYRADGLPEVIGRIDHQIKLRGFRIELGEIETALGRHPDVQSAVVLVREDDGQKRLVAYAISDSGRQSAAAEIRSFLKDGLPDYMIPSDVMWLDAFPLAPNGKIDRKSFPAPERARREDDSDVAEPAGPLEVLMADIWKDVLGIDDVSVYDTFFDLGGHSLLALKVADRFETESGVRINPGELINQTLRQTVARHEGAEDGQPGGRSLAGSLRDRFRRLMSRRQ